MRVHFNCPRCGKSLKADSSLAGKKATCTRCGHRLAVPGDPPATESDLEEMEHDQEEAGSEDEEETQIVPPPVRSSGASSSRSVEGAAAAPSGSAIVDDNAPGLASMYLGAVVLVLFLSSNLVGGGAISLLGLHFALAMNLAFCLTCIVVSWVGWRLAREARVQAAAQHGRGKAYATAAVTVHAIFLLLNVGMAGALAFAWAAGPQSATVVGGQAVPGLPMLGDVFKQIGDLQKEIDKLAK
ncbi:MAG TPA: hypothetical protein PKD86_00920 [Gemmatales bacterium]|nr:hypothetical protein [Gemmatales bacterium]HMP57885.1 hypothetical protein [Gemmatales bacterium]